MEKILVTGGAGFIGSTLCEKLLDSGKAIICLDNFNDYYSPEIKRNNLSNCLENENFKLIKADIREKEKLSEIFAGEEFDKVVHLAALAGVRYSIDKPQLFEDVNVKGTLNLLELAKDKNLKNFVFASSSSVYGVSKKIPFKEDDSGNPISPYGKTKQSGEKLCREYSEKHGMNISCLRFFTVYGPRQRPDMAIHKFTDLIENGKEIPLFGDGKSQRDYTYIDDIVAGIAAAVDKEFKFEIFNLGNSKTVELNYLVSLIEKELGKKAKINRLPNQEGDVPITYADISKSREMLGFNPKTPIEEGIVKFVEWYMGK
ncbi:MAG: GDP-mannose 4,6-dehydratase [Candidatus Diapherotrites archaeon]